MNKKKLHHLLAFSRNRNLTRWWVSNTRCSRLEEFDFSGTPPSQTRQSAVITLIPPRQLLCSHSIGAITLVQPFNQGRASGIATANIESPADQSTVLVRVEFDRVLDILGDALASSLESNQC